MSIRTERRAAELAVIEAARYIAYVAPQTGALSTDGKGISTLVGAYRALEALPLPVPNRARANKGAPVTAQQAAAWFNGERAANLAGEVFKVIWHDHLHPHRYGSTTEEIEHRLGGKHQTISPRVNELAETGWICESGRKRKNASGRMAIVWTPTWSAEQAMLEGPGRP